MHHRQQTMRPTPRTAHRQLALAALLALFASLALTAPSALAFRGHEFSFSFGETGSGNGQFSEPTDVAVNDATGQVYVLDQGNGRIERFSAAGAFEAQFDGSETPAKAFFFRSEALTGGIAIDNSCYFKKLTGSACTAADPSNGDVYVTDPGNKVVDKFSAEGIYLGQLEEASGGGVFEFIGLPIGGIEAGDPDGVSVDLNGLVWVYAGPDVPSDVYRFTNAEPSTFVAPKRQMKPLGDFPAPGFAVDSEDNLYLRRHLSFEQAFAVSESDSSGEPVVAPLAREETSAVAVDLASDEVFLDNVSSVGAFSSSGTEQERFGAENGVAHLSSGSGLAVNHESATNSTVYVVDAQANVVAVFPPEPPSVPLIVGESVSKVTANSASLEAEINPHGASSEYHFEYGACTAPSMCEGSPFDKSIPSPEAVAGADFEVHSVSANPQDLSAGTTYHFRVVAHNEKDAPETFVSGAERVFRTQPAGGFELPDARGWEMVSPLDKHGALLEPIGEGGVVQAAVTGDAITYLADAPTEADPKGNAVKVQVLSTRGTGAWSSRDIAIPHDGATGPSTGNGSEYRFFSSDLSLGIVQPFGAFTPSLSDEASEQTAFLRTNYSHGNINEPCPQSCYHPLVTGCPVEEECQASVQEHANVEAGTVFGEEGKCPPQILCGPQFRGATPDMSHVVLNSPVALTSSSRAVKEGLYEWSAGQLALLSMLPVGEGGKAVSGGLGDRGSDTRHAISNDGSRVVWTSSAAEPHLYLRDRATEETIRLDVGLTGTPEFQSANADVSKVFFTENQDLYEYDVESAKLLHLTEGAEVRFALPALSEDGSVLYFVANGVLAAGAKAGQCSDLPLPGATCNLYELHDGAVTLVAVLSGADNADWNTVVSRLTVRSSPDGHWLAFMSQRSLTGYDNRDAISGKRDEEVYLYDATHATGPGNPVCVSCDPSGARPTGVEYGQLGSSPGMASLVGGSSVWREQWLAANVPGWTPYANAQALYQSRYLSNSGRLFFNSNEALVSQDVNGTWDVYEYEPLSVGNCSSSSTTFGERSGGCVAMLSSGASPEESAFLDASENGDDVFFLTAGKLSRQDNDTSLDIYDAHVCSAQSPCIKEPQTAPPLCSTEASCRQAPTPQPEIFGFPASATFSGLGNITPAPAPVSLKAKALTRGQRLAKALKICKKDKVRKKRVACERQTKRKFAKRVKAKKSNANKKGNR
jgi:NHL repeat